MILSLRVGLAVGFTATLALAAPRLRPHAPDAHPMLSPLAPVAATQEGSNAAGVGCAALAVGVLGLFARSRRR